MEDVTDEEALLVEGPVESENATLVDAHRQEIHDALRERQEEPKKKEEEKKDAASPSPLLTAGFISRLTFSWSSPLISKGYQSPLRMEDLYDLPPTERVKTVHKRAEELWRENEKLGDSYWYLIKSIYGIDFRRYLLLGLSYILYILLNMLHSVTLSYLIQYTSDNDAPLWWGALLALLAFLLPALRSFSEHYYYFHIERIGIRWRIAVISLVYNKSLEVGKVSKGNANNLLNVDPAKISNLCWLLHRAWGMPLHIFASVVLLYYWLGISALAAVFILAVLAPLNYWMLSGFGKTQDRIMGLTDERVKGLSELLQGILVVKLFSWEDFVYSKLEKIRNEEVGHLKKFAYLLAMLMFLSLSISSFISVGTFSLYALLGNTLTADKVFPSLMLFGGMTWPILQIPGMVSRVAEARASFIRVNRFLRRRALKAVPSVNGGEGDAVISLLRADFEWESEASIYEEKKEEKTEVDKKDDGMKEVTLDVKVVGGSEVLQMEDEGSGETQENGEEGSEDESGTVETGEEEEKLHHFRLRNITFQVERGQLVAIIGRVGSGKTSLLQAILGEMNLKKGKLARDDNVCFVAQRAWIRNASLRENILFDNPYDESKYRSVLQICALESDMKVLPDGDRTEIGENGVNLSGGQKQRVALARALYSDRDIYLLDDPLSAVDANVGQHLFREFIVGALKNRGKTVVLVTHQLQYLPFVDKIFIMAKGTIQKTGTYETLLGSGIDFSEVVKKKKREDEKREKVAVVQSGEIEEKEEPETDKEGTQFEKNELSCSTIGSDRSEAGKLTDGEERMTGAVEWHVYLGYMLSTGPWFYLLFLLVISVLMELCNNFSRFWLAVWSDDRAPDVKFYLGIYLSVALGASFLSFLRQFSWATGTLNCAKKLHNDLLRAILRAPMTFFFATPSGRIISRFSKDQGSVDTEIPDMMSDWFLCMFSTTSTILVICMVMPWFIIACIPIGCVYYFVQGYFRKSSRELGRLMSMSASPIYAQYAETLEGLDTIRAFQKEKAMIKENAKLVETNMSAYLQTFVGNRWLGIRIEAISAVSVFIISVLAVITKGHLQPGFVGLMLTLVAQMNDDLNWMVRSGTALESNMNRVERIGYYIKTPPEAPLFNPSFSAPDGWPFKGEIIFNDVWMKYREDLNPVLKGLSCTLRPQEKIGIVGRTGAGKSSFISALFRLIEPYAGTITIDGIDISKLGLRELRNAITIIPQDPFLFSVTIRTNLDPFCIHEDKDLWLALDRVHMKEHIQLLPFKLESAVMAGGSNFSVGQRQLLCMARALLKHTKILIMDEATASVDTETDGIIQETVREHFADRTVLTIAHRLDTIMDSDRVLVMDQGMIVECDNPLTLLDNENGIFHSLVQSTGSVSASYLRSLAVHGRRGSQ